MNTFLKRLEIQGFKSFANKTVFDFPSRIAGIVGPNGSGKSNIVDSLRWVLGERTAKNLRGDSLENLIFAGTAKKSRASLARVSLCFNNESELFPIESAEVVIERKVDRAGNSQFFLNNSEVKLKDLTLIFARTKLGTRGLTIIGQGQSDIFVKSAPKDRRMMIEEILGLRESRLKKEEAERRLEATRINIEKVQAMIEELAPHIRFLRKQKHRWDKKTEIEHGLYGLENRYFAYSVKKLDEELKKTKEPIQQLSAEKSKKEESVRALEILFAEFDKENSEVLEFGKLQKEIEKLFDERSFIEKEIVRLETRMEFQKIPHNAPSYSFKELQEKTKELYEDIKITAELENITLIKTKLKQWLNVLEKFFSSTVKKQEEENKNKDENLALLKEKLNLIAQKIEQAKSEENSLRELQKKHNYEFRHQVEKLESEKNQLRNIERRIQSIDFECEKIKLKIEELKNQWHSFGRSEKDWVSLKEEDRAEAFGDLSLDTEKKIMKLYAELSAIGEIDTEVIKEAEETEKRNQFLENELSDLESTALKLKDLISDLAKRIDFEFRESFKKINEAFDKYFGLMFGGGKAKLRLIENELAPQNETDGDVGKNVSTQTENVSDTKELSGIDVLINIPRKKIKSLEMLSGGEKSLVSLAALFALISISTPPFLVLDEIDAALDDENAQRFSELVRVFSKQSQFIIITHNRNTIENADLLYGITMGDDGVSKVLSLKLDK